MIRFDIMEPVSLTGASNTLALTAQQRHVRVSHSSATQLTVPPNSSVAYLIGAAISVEQSGAGQVEVVQGSGVTIRTAETLKLRKQYACATLIKVGADEWVLAGDLELA